MPIKSDRWIRKMALEARMIEPFAEKQVREGVISYGLSSYGYDFRISDRFLVFKETSRNRIDPKQFDKDSFIELNCDVCLLPPNSFMLASTVEYFRIPRNILTICFGKSTYARCGIIVNITPFEPEWEGHATIGISNTTPRQAMIYGNEGIGQLIFMEADEICETSYADKNGKYQKQRGITYPKVDQALKEFSIKRRVQKAVSDIEKSAISEMLQKTNWNRRKAARLLDISYRSLLYKIKEYRIMEE